MVKESPSRRGILQGIATGAIGLSGLAAGVNNVEADAGTREWMVSNTVEGDNTVNATLSVGYYGSEMVTRWDSDQFKYVDKWAHYFEASFCAHDEYEESYNISSQMFDTRFYNGTKKAPIVPSAGATAYPDPPGGNWSQVALEVVKQTVGQLSKVGGLTLAAESIYDAYNEKPFDTTEPRKIHFDALYKAYMKETVSHSVHFVADQDPNSSGMVDTVAGAHDYGIGQDVIPFVYMYPDEGNLPEPSGYTSSTTSSTSTSDNSGYQEMLDGMSQKELAKYGISRVKASKPVAPRSMTGQSKSRDRDHKYIKNFNMDVEFGAEGGTVVNTVNTQ